MHENALSLFIDQKQHVENVCVVDTETMNANRSSALLSFARSLQGMIFFYNSMQVETVCVRDRMAKQVSSHNLYAANGQDDTTTITTANGVN